MNVLGIIAEYNPFHNGHLYQLQKSVELTKADFVIAIMSGNFTQRGEPAVFSKKIRAEAAVRSGIDLIIELPFAFACNNAEYFAKGAVSILNGLGCVTHLSFGSESGDLESLKSIAHFLANETDDFKHKLKENLALGMSYPKARAEAVCACIGKEAFSLMNEPNNILAIEYLKQLQLLEGDIIPITVKRYAADYHDTALTGDIASASAIRKVLLSPIPTASEDEIPTTFSLLEAISDFLPLGAVDAIAHNSHEICLGAITQKSQEFLYYKLLTAKILTAKNQDLAGIFSVGEGLENKLKSEVRCVDSLAAFKDSLKSKRYTATRINRMLLHTLVGLTKTDFHEILNSQKYYARILGFNEKGAKLLKHVKKSGNATLPCITNINKESDRLLDSQLLLSYDLISSDLYNLLTEKSIYANSEQMFKPFRI